MRLIALAILSAAATSAVAFGHAGTVQPPLPAPAGPAGRQAPPVTRGLPPVPPPPTANATFPGRRVVVVRRVVVEPGGRVVVTSGPGALVPGVTLLDLALGPDAAPRQLLVAVAARRDTEALPALVVVRS